MKRHELLHYVDTSMGSGSPTYALLGDGITSLSEEMNPEEETQQWNNQENGDSEVKSYTPSIEVESRTASTMMRRHGSIRWWMKCRPDRRR